MGQLGADVSTQLWVSFFTGQAVQCLTVSGGTDSLSLKVGNQLQPKIRNIVEEERPQIRRGGSLKSYIIGKLKARNVESS